MQEKGEANPFRWDLEDAGLGGNYEIMGKKVGLRTEKEQFSGDVPEAPHKEFVIRSPKGEQQTHEEMKQGLALLNELKNDYDIRLPWLAAVRGDRSYLVVGRVQGEDLFDAVKHPDDRVVQEFEDNVVNWLRYFEEKSTQGGKYLRDAVGQHQYVYGKAKGDTEAHVYLVDLDFDIGEVKVENPETLQPIYDRYHWLAIETRLAEERSGQTLHRARRALFDIAERLPEDVQKMILSEISG